MRTYYDQQGRTAISYLPAVRSQVAEKEPGQASSGLPESEMQEPLLGSSEKSRKKRAIKVQCGRFIIVSDEDYQHLSQYTWSLTGKIGCEYACHYQDHHVRGGKQLVISMHRLVWEMCYGEIPENMEIDHINGDRLDNRIENLRLCTRHQNIWNSRKRKNTKYKFKGVRPQSNTTWCADICYQGKSIHLGSFPSEMEAARAYDKKAKELFGEFACLNFP